MIEDIDLDTEPKKKEKKEKKEKKPKTPLVIVADLIAEIEEANLINDYELQRAVLSLKGALNFLEKSKVRFS